MTPNAQLEKFYRSLQTRAPAELGLYSGLRGPDLIWLDDEYLSSKPRMAIIGQQVGDWYYDYPEFVKKWSVGDAIREYQEFDFAFSEKEPGYRSSPFWRFFHTVRKSAFPTEPEARRKVLWTNLLKFVAKDGTSVIWKPYAEAEGAIQLQEDVLVNELRIAKPHVCLFVTGPDFDCVLKRYFRGLSFDQLHLPERQLARLIHPQLPRHSYRTYHPNYLSHQPRLWSKVLHILLRELVSLPQPA